MSFYQKNQNRISYVNSVKLFDKIVMIILLLSQILDIYGLESYSFGYIIISIMAVISLFRYKTKCNVPHILLLYLFYLILTSALHATNPSEYVPLNYIRNILVVIMFFNVFNFDWFIKWYRILAIVFMSFFFFQEITYYTIGSRILGIISFLPFRLAGGDYEKYLVSNELSDRLCSFFSEPAHFAQFLLPLLSVELYAKYKGNKMFCVLIILTLLLTQSGNAIVGLLAISVIYIYNIICVRKLSTSMKIALVGAFLLLSSTLAYFAVNTEKGVSMMDRTELMTDSSIKSGNMSEFIRIYRGYYIYGTFSPSDMIFGIGNQSMFDKYISHSVLADIIEDGDYYVNTIQFFLIYTGLIGLVFYILILANLWKKTDIVGKSCLATLFLLSFVANLFLSSTMLICFLVAHYHEVLFKRSATKYQVKAYEK